MKLEYTYGCTCDSLTIDGEETVDLEIEELRNAIRFMISSKWKEGNDFYWLMKYLVETLGEHRTLTFGPNPLHDCVETFYYEEDKLNYLALIDIPTERTLIVSQVICTYTGLTRQEKWDGKKHITKARLEVVRDMISKLDDVCDLQWIFCKFLETFGKYRSLGRCDCCGDSISEYTLTI